jgi:hypothetical protein
MSFLPFRWLACLALIAAPLTAQSNTVLENPFIRVIDAVDVPHRKTALHKHDFNRVMIYITPGNLDITGEDGHTDHQHWKTGDVAWSPAGPLHVSENVGTGDLRIIEVEVRKLAGAAAPRNPSFDPIVVDPKHNQLIFENPQVRVLRSSLDVDGREKWHEHAGEGRLTVLLTPLAARLDIQKKQSKPMNGGLADVFWSEGVMRHRATNLGNRPAQVVVVEVK